MTVLSRSKKRRCAGHKARLLWTGSRRLRPRAVHTHSGHPQFSRRPGRVCPPSTGVGACRPTSRAAAPSPSARRQLRRGADRRPPPAAGSEPARRPSWPRAVRRSGGPPATPRWSSSAPTRSAAAPCGRSRAGPGWSSCPVVPTPTGWAAAVEVGAERVAVLPEDRRGCCPGPRPPRSTRRPGMAGRRGRQLRRRRGEHGGGRDYSLAAAPGVVLVDADPWGAGLDLLLGAERVEGLRWPEPDAPARPDVDRGALMAALPEVDGVHVLAASRSAPRRCPTRR